MEPFVKMMQEVADARNVAELRGFRDRAHGEFQRRLLFTQPLEWSRQVNAWHDSMIWRIVEWAEADLCEEGHGAAPVPFAFVLFGSGGRGEQTLWSDQDNGIIYADPSSEEEKLAAEAYFPILAQKITAHLEAAGYPPCSGGVICTNHQWMQSISGYKQMLMGWLADPNWEHVRYLLIAADLRTVYGDEALGREVLDVLYSYVAAHPGMLEHMLHNTLHHKVSIGVFGQLIKERYGEDAGGVEIKYGAYIPIVNGVRLLAVEAGIRSTSTEERLQRLISDSKVEDEIGNDFLEALTIAMRLRSLTPYQLEAGHYSTRGKLSAEQLTKERMTELKLCLRIGMDLQRYVKKSVQKEMEKGE
ncbi:hypothetical protein FPZ49_19510 [Paenibacillus cremeus]|uniref:Signal transduction protein n=2 Tax=Paenibacillus cremeus TaxID=2163881 RepID=A0A559K865_9BACL|nr:hypothetical protein FPZ49_19510 [Paenibacillus cremeus]